MGEAVPGELGGRASSWPLGKNLHRGLNLLERGVLMDVRCESPGIPTRGEVGRKGVEQLGGSSAVNHHRPAGTKPSDARKKNVVGEDWVLKNTTGKGKKDAKETEKKVPFNAGGKKHSKFDNEQIQGRGKEGTDVGMQKNTSWSKKATNTPRRTQPRKGKKRFRTKTPKPPHRKRIRTKRTQDLPKEPRGGETR